MIKVSVILPIYNGEDTISKTLDSLVNQTYTNFEVVACIDGSKDNSERILNEYKTKFKRLTILNNIINQGLGPTMNRLIHQTEGEYLAVAEQDDFYYPDRLQLQVDRLDKDKSIGLVSGISEFWDGKEARDKFPGILVLGKQYPEGKEMFLLNYKKQIKVVNSCMMIRKSVHVDNGLYFTQHYPSISVDWTYILRFSLVSRIYGLNKVLVRLDRRVDRNSVTSNKIKQFKAARELIRSFAYEYPDIISETDYNYALRSQFFMEICAKSGMAFMISWLGYFIKCPTEKRYIDILKKRIFKKLKLN